MERTRAENRFNSRRKALRKRRIDRQTQGRYSTTPYYDNLHQYSKNKIHCSCPMCSPKTRNKGKRRYRDGNYSRSLHYRASDLRKLIAMDADESDYFHTTIRKRRTKDW